MSSITLDQIREILPGARSYSHYVAGLCPFHEDNKPSLMVYEDNFFRCLGCGVVGNYEQLWRKLNGRGASKIIRAEEKFSAPYLPTDLREQEELVETAHESLMKFEQLQWYLENRGVMGRAEPCRLGYFKGWYTIPIYSHYGEYRGMVARAGGVVQKATGFRFIQPHGQHSMMYCPDWNLMEDARTIAVVFGMFDALAISDLRYAVVTPIAGQASFNPEWLNGFRKPVVIIPDAREETEAIKLAGELGWRGKILRLNYPEGVHDPAGFFEVGQRENLNRQIGGALS